MKAQQLTVIVILMAQTLLKWWVLYCIVVAHDAILIVDALLVHAVLSFGDESVPERKIYKF